MVSLRHTGANFNRSFCSLAIDMPLMTEDYLRLICNLVEGRAVAFSHDRNCAEPLVAIYPKAPRTDFITALSGSDFSLNR